MSDELLPQQQDDRGLVLVNGDSLEVMRTMRARQFDAVVTDPPYEIGFMGKGWDRAGTTSDPYTWQLVRRLLKPGGHLLAFAAAKTYHRLACAVEDAGLEVCDMVLWLYGTGVPRGLTRLKPAHEPILLARRPSEEKVKLNVDECRVPYEGEVQQAGASHKRDNGYNRPWMTDLQKLQAWKERVKEANTKRGELGRYPANVVFDGSTEVKTSVLGKDGPAVCRLFYATKPSTAERGAYNDHPTVKPVDLMQWLVRLVCGRGGLVLDPFAGSGTTGLAARSEGRKAVLIENHLPYLRTAERRLNLRSVDNFKEES